MLTRYCSDHTHQLANAYEVRSLVSNSIYAMPVPTKSLLKTSPDAAMLLAPFGCTHSPPPVPPFLLMQNLV